MPGTVHELVDLEAGPGVGRRLHRFAVDLTLLAGLRAPEEGATPCGPLH